MQSLPQVQLWKSWLYELDTSWQGRVTNVCWAVEGCSYNCQLWPYIQDTWRTILGTLAPSLLGPYTSACCGLNALHPGRPGSAPLLQFVGAHDDQHPLRTSTSSLWVWLCWGWSRNYNTTVLVNEGVQPGFSYPWSSCCWSSQLQ